MSETKAKPSFTEKYKELWKFIKFSIAGASSTLVEMGVFYLLQYVVFKSILNAQIPTTWPQWLQSLLELLKLTEGTGYLYAYIISTTIGYAIAFVLNRKMTFHADSNVARSTILYILMVIFTIIATAYIGTQYQLWFADSVRAENHFLFSWTYRDFGDATGKIVAATAATAWTYPLNRFVIHRHKKTTDEAVEDNFEEIVEEA